MFELFNFGENISYQHLDDLRENIPLENQIYSLKEDTLQVSYKNGCIIDVGWYPEFDLSGKFRIALIKNENWEFPVMEKFCRDLKTLKYLVEECMRLIE